MTPVMVKLAMVKLARACYGRCMTRAAARVAAISCRQAMAWTAIGCVEANGC